MKDLLTQDVWVTLWIVSMVALLIVAIYTVHQLYREIREEHDAELIHRGWLNHEEWLSDQVRKYRSTTHDWNGVPVEIRKSERGEYLWTIPFVKEPDEADK